MAALIRFTPERISVGEDREIVVREATADDAEELLAFVSAMAPELNIEPGEFWVKSVEQERSELAAFAACENSLFLVACQESRIVATLTLASRDLRVGQGRAAERHVVHVGLSVAAGYRSKGIGRQLLEAGIGWCRRGGVITRLEISSYSTNVRGRAIYRQLGFVEEGIKRRAIRRGSEWIDVYMLALLLDD